MTMLSAEEYNRIKKGMRDEMRRSESTSDMNSITQAGFLLDQVYVLQEINETLKRIEQRLAAADEPEAYHVR